MLLKHFLSIVPFENFLFLKTFFFFKESLELEIRVRLSFYFSRCKIIMVSSHTFILEGWSSKRVEDR